MKYREHSVQRHGHRIYAREYEGAEPAIILMHGFPDNLHLYDRLVPFLSPGRRVVTFDFLGWGASDKPENYSYTAANQVGELDAVIKGLSLEQIVLVAHDASGPPAIDWALKHPERIAGLVLLNTYYGEMPTLRPLEAIFLFSTPYHQNFRPASFSDVWGPDLPQNVLVASRQIFQRWARQGRISAIVLSAIRGGPQHSSSLFWFK